MRRHAFLCLALTTGALSLAQQPSEWRPNIAEDNKGATWEDTTAFLSSILSTESRRRDGTLVVSDVSPGERCTLNFIEKWFEERDSDWFHRKRVDDWANYYVTSVRGSIDFKKVDPLSISIKGEQEQQVYLRGTDNRAFLAVAQSKYDTQRLVNRSMPDLARLYFVPCADNSQSKSCVDSENTAFEWSFWFTDGEYSKRVARALMHAALLCGGTKAVSPF